VTPRLLPVSLVAACALIYPAAVIVGGSPRFPSRAECVRAPRTDGPLEAVFGRFESYRGAQAALRDVLVRGFKGAVIEPDGCGLLKIVVHGVPNRLIGQDLIEEVRTVGLTATLEQSAP
jgi:hypothetical protein